MLEPKAITSLQNERVKAIRALEMRKARKETGLFVAEGASLLITARDNGFVPKTLVYRAGSATSDIAKGLVQWALGAGVECLEVSEAVLGKLSSKDNPQSMIGVFEQRWSSLPKPEKVEDGAVWLALEEVRDPGNLGTIIRTADAAGASGVILVGESTDPFSMETVRATMGSVFAVPLVKATAADFLAWKKGAGVQVVATHLAGAVDYRTIDYRKKPVVLLMGNEQSGLPDEIAREADALARIPQAGRADSLNLAIATGVMLFEARRHLLTLEERA